MNLTVKEGPADLPAFSIDEPTQLEIRDPEGYLVMFIRFLRDGHTMLICKKEDEDFNFNAKEHRIPLHVAPGTTQTPSGIIIG